MRRRIVYETKLTILGRVRIGLVLGIQEGLQDDSRGERIQVSLPLSTRNAHRAARRLSFACAARFVPEHDRQIGLTAQCFSQPRRAPR
jgi:hypothetical protein